ncbi:Tn3 family transposase [Streptosporangium vulgare]|uniref:Tn3 family transposase n=1 Tax=Streptosporangium vulgare TaxID=46190 RepID=A0ABV5TSE5_9ACTN
MRHLETSSVDDALDVLDLLITSNLPARAERAGKAEQLRTFPKLRKAARTMASAVEVLMSAPEATEDRLVSLVEVWKAIEEVVPREKLASAVETIAAFVPTTDDDAAAEWRAELIKRYRTVQGFIELLLATIQFRAVEAGTAVLAMVHAAAAMAKTRRRYGPGDITAHEALITGSWRPLIYRNPDLPEGRSTRRRSCCARSCTCTTHCVGAMCSPKGLSGGAPRARLLDGQAWQQAQSRILTSLELEVEPAGHLAELASALEGAYTRVLDGLGANTAAQFVGGRLQLEKLGAAEGAALSAGWHAAPAGFSRVAAGGVRPYRAARRLHPHLRRRLTHGGLPGQPGRAVRGRGVQCRPGADREAEPRARLLQVDQGYLRGETIAAANARLIAAQAELDIVRCWGGGHIASADGLRFVVPVQNLHTGHNPVYFGRQRGATWMNVVNDQVVGIGGLVVPGTLRDSLFILDAIRTLDGGPKPETVVTDTASYSDIVSGLFAICGYQFSPRIADLGGTRLWRTNTRAVYGPLEHMSRHTVRLDKIRAHWGDMVRVAGSLTLGTVRAYDLIRMLSADGRTTGLGEAFAHYGRIFKTLHLLQYIADQGYRRMIGTQLNVQEARHRLARKIAFGNRGLLRQRYREGLEDQLGSLGLALNAVIWWNSLYLDAAVKHLREQGFPVTDEMCARLSPIQYDHINFLGRYAFSRAGVAGGLRPFHDGAHESA